MQASLSPPPRPWLAPSPTAAEVFLWGQEHREYSIEAAVYGGMGCNAGKR